MPALILKRSSRLIPGLPVVVNLESEWQSDRHTGNASGNDNDVDASEGLLHAIVCGKMARDGLDYSVTELHFSVSRVHTAGVEMCERSAATPLTLTTS